MGTHESTVVIRMPEGLKKNLKMEAKKLGMSISELVRRKLLALEESEEERRAMIRLGGNTYEIEEVLRPEVISYENRPSVPRPLEEIDALELPSEKKSRSKKWGGGLSETALAMLGSARRSATGRFNDSIVMLEHLLVILCESPETNAGRLLALFGVDREGIVGEIEDLLKVSGVSLHIGTVPVATTLTEVLDRGRKEAENLGAAAAGTEHLLLGILGRGESVAATSLNSEGMYYDDLLSVIRNRTD